MVALARSQPARRRELLDTPSPPVAAGNLRQGLGPKRSRGSDRAHP